MALLSIPARHHFRSLTRLVAYHILPVRPISTGWPRSPRPFFPPPPARRRFEHVPPPTADKNQGTADPNLKRIERRPTNRQIPFEHVFVLDPETNKPSPTKQNLKGLLETWSKKGRVIELVASSPNPIVRVTTRNEVEAQYRKIKRALRKGARVGEESKEVQLTWGVAKADLEHKLRKAKRDLEKGYRVIVVVTMKNRHKPFNRKELVAFAEEVSRTLCDVGEEWKEREFTDRLMVLSFRKAQLDGDTLSNDNPGDIYST